MSCIRNGKIRHNPDIIASTIIEMICNDLKFHDMQNNTEYLLLQSVLKEQKKEDARRQRISAFQNKIMRTKRLPGSKEQTTTKKDSKFKEKYSDRVKSIQNTEAQMKANRKVAEEIEKMKNQKMKETLRHKPRKH